MYMFEHVHVHLHVYHASITDSSRLMLFTDMFVFLALQPIVVVFPTAQ